MKHAITTPYPPSRVGSGYFLVLNYREYLELFDNPQFLG
jgi:hypothetical protein